MWAPFSFKIGLLEAFVLGLTLRRALRLKLTLRAGIADGVTGKSSIVVRDSS